MKQAEQYSNWERERERREGIGGTGVTGGIEGIGGMGGLEDVEYVRVRGEWAEHREKGRKREQMETRLIINFLRSIQVI